MRSGRTRRWSRPWNKCVSTRSAVYYASIQSQYYTADHVKAYTSCFVV